MKRQGQKQVLGGIILGMISCLFFSCSAFRHSHSSAASKQLSVLDENRFKKLYYDGLIQQIQGNNDDAVSIFKQCLAINPSSPAANFEIAQLFDNNKQPDSAFRYIQKAVAGDPKNIWYGNFYAQDLQELGQYKEVVKVYEELIKTNPHNDDLYYKLALAQLQDREYKEALKTYSILQSGSDSTDEELSMNKIEILERIKEYAKAEEEIQKLIKRNPATVQYYDMLGNLYDIEGKYNKAYEIYKQIEEEHPHDPMVHLSLADYYKTTNQDGPAYEELKKAFAEPALDIDTKIRIILALNTFTNTDSIFNEALTLSHQMVLSAPAEPRAHAIYGEFLQHSGDLSGARIQYRTAVSEDSSRYNYWSQLLEVEAQLNDAENLQAESMDAIGLFPTNARLYYYNGLANMQLKKYNTAIHSFKSGVFYVTNDSNLLDLFYQNIGDANYFMRRYAASDSAYDEALRINPNNDYVLNNYSYFLSLRDTNLALAEKMSKKSNGLVQNNSSYEDTYAWVLYKSGKYQTAKEWEDKAMLDGGGKDPVVLEHYGNILFKLGDHEGALNYWQKAKDAGADSGLLQKEIRDKQLYEK